MLKSMLFWKPTIISVALSPLFLMVGIASAGMGHGDYFLAKLLFPTSMFLTVVFEVITGPLFLLAIAQFPIYGTVLGIMNFKGRLMYGFILLWVTHLIAVGLCFAFIGESFG